MTLVPTLVWIKLSSHGEFWRLYHPGACFFDFGWFLEGNQLDLMLGIEYFSSFLTELCAHSVKNDKKKSRPPQLSSHSQWTSPTSPKSQKNILPLIQILPFFSPFLLFQMFLHSSKKSATPWILFITDF